MKEILLAVTGLFFSFAIFTNINAQDSRCAGWQADLENAEKKEEQVRKKKNALQDFINLMDDPESGPASLEEELANTEKHIQDLQKKITAGDKTIETAEELQSYRTYAEFMKQRLNKSVNESAIFNNPKYKALEKKLYELRNAETDASRDVASISAEMKANNCPGKKKTDQLDDIELEGSWPGTWKYTDPSGKMIITMILNGSGSSVTGNVNWVMPDGNPIYWFKNCKETGPNKISCDYNVTYEGDDHFADITGTVEMTLAGDMLSSMWREGNLKARWKPGKEKKDKLRELISFPLTLKKEK